MKLTYLVAFVMLIAMSGCRKSGNKTTAYDFTYAGSMYTYNAIGFSSTAPSGSTYLWKFGDGSVSASPSPSHKYSYNDSFVVTLIVNGDAVHAVSKTLYISSTTQRMAGNYGTKTECVKSHQKRVPIDHSLFPYTSNWPMLYFGVNIINDSTVSVLDTNSGFHDLYTCNLVDSLMTDSTFFFASQRGYVYVTYCYKNDNLYYDLEQPTDPAGPGYDIFSFKLK